MKLIIKKYWTAKVMNIKGETKVSPFYLKPFDK